MAIAVFEQAPRRNGEVLLAHISDLHFTTTTDPADDKWAALKEDLSRYEVDVLVATGDVIDGSVPDSLRLDGVREAFVLARTYMVALCSSLAIDPASALMVVPGNHDYRLKGILSPRWFSTPAFDAFQDIFRAECSSRLFPKLRLALFAFNSNTADFGVNAATGLVERTELVSFAEQVRNLQQQMANDWQMARRIALLHHHPMPIAATELRKGPTDREEFLLLKNAGTFMTELVRASIDLVLHGHKHHPAFSRAVFAQDESTQHSLGVIAAGSVGQGQPPSYNLVTIRDSGEIMVERRALESATYARAAHFYVETYESARVKRFIRYSDPQGVRVHRYTRCDRIQADSGDSLCDETFDGVRAASQPQRGLTHVFSSKSGRHSKKEYSGITPRSQKLTWEWLDELEPGQARKARTIFAPPLSRNTPISFMRSGTTFNAYHFNQRDRLDVTNQVSTTENALASIRYSYELFYLQIVFPAGRFPPSAYVAVQNEDGADDLAEQEYAAARLALFPEARTLILALERPIPKHTYAVHWELPPTEADELALGSEADAGAEEVSGRLQDDEIARGKVCDALTSLLGELTAAYQPPTGKDTIECRLYSHSEGKHGLICLAGTLGASGEAAPIPVGQTIVGLAHRCRIPLFRTLREKHDPQDTSFAEPLIGAPRWTPSAMAAIPLTYPVLRGRRIAVLYVASHAKTSPMIALQGDASLQGHFLRNVRRWYSEGLAAALDVGSLPGFSNLEL